MMKTNISFQPTNVSGHQNHSIVKSGTYNLTELDAGEATEILADAVIEYLPRVPCEEIIKDWVSKLGHGGKISITFDDLHAVTRLFFLQRITFAECNFLLQGPMIEPWQDKKINFTIPEVSKILESYGLKVITKELEGVKALVVAVRE